jgi:hypothetical protein
VRWATALLAGITYGIQPYGGHTMGWENPWVLGFDTPTFTPIFVAARLPGWTAHISAHAFQTVAPFGKVPSG